MEGEEASRPQRSPLPVQQVFQRSRNFNPEVEDAMFGLGWSEIFIIVLVGLLVIGPDKLPEVARGLAKTIRGVQRLAAEVRYSINLDEMQAHNTQRPTPMEDPSPPPATGNATPGNAPPPATGDATPGSAPPPAATNAPPASGSPPVAGGTPAAGGTSQVS